MKDLIKNPFFWLFILIIAIVFYFLGSQYSKNKFSTLSKDDIIKRINKVRADKGKTVIDDYFNYNASKNEYINRLDDEITDQVGQLK